MGQDRKIIDNEFSDMEVIDTKKSVKYDYKDKTRKREKLEEKEEDGNKKVQIWVRKETLDSLIPVGFTTFRDNPMDKN